MDLQLSEAARHVMTQLGEAAAAATLPNDDPNYDLVNALSSNIYGNQGRTCIPRAKIPMFHKRRRLDFSQFPADLG